MTAPHPRIGLRIRQAMERKRLDQAAVARKLGVSRSAVNAWINDRAWPANSVGALEDLLEISLYEVPQISPAVRRKIRLHFPDPEMARRVLGFIECMYDEDEPPNGASSAGRGEDQHPA